MSTPTWNRQAMSGTAVVLPIRSCLPICHRGWTIVMRSCSWASQLTRSAPRGLWRTFRTVNKFAVPSARCEGWARRLTQVPSKRRRTQQQEVRVIVAFNTIRVTKFVEILSCAVLWSLCYCPAFLCCCGSCCCWRPARRSASGFSQLFNQQTFSSHCFCSCPCGLSDSDLKCVTLQPLTLRCFTVPSQMESW